MVPIATMRIAWAITMPSIARRSAHIAMRMPISTVRAATLCASTAERPTAASNSARPANALVKRAMTRSAPSVPRTRRSIDAKREMNRLADDLLPEKTVADCFAHTERLRASAQAGRLPCSRIASGGKKCSLHCCFSSAAVVVGSTRRTHRAGRYMASQRHCVGRPITALEFSSALACLAPLYFIRAALPVPAGVTLPPAPTNPEVVV